MIETTNHTTPLPEEHPTEIFMQLRRMATRAGVDERDARALTERFLLALAGQNGAVAREVAVERGWIEDE